MKSEDTLLQVGGREEMDDNSVHLEGQSNFCHVIHYNIVTLMSLTQRSVSLKKTFISRNAT